VAPGFKTGGRKKGISRNKPKPIKLAPTDENRQLALMASTMAVRTPKAVMLDAMLFFDGMARKYQADQDHEKAAKSMVLAVQVAEKVAPYIHARLIAMESREGAEERVPYVIRAPAVMADSSAWQAAVGAAVVDMEASQAVQAPLAGPVASAAPAASSAPAALPVVLGPDAKSGRITVMPAGPRVVQPAGTEEWLAEVDRERRRAGGS
jgi:hypothetical protein